MNLISFLKLFPVIAPPLTLTDESIFAFSKKNKLINQETALEVMSKLEPDFDEQEDREYVPCCALEVSDEFHTLIYWRASTLNYEYYVINLDKKGQLLDRRLIAGLIAQEGTVVRMYVSIDINLIFYIAAHAVDEQRVAQTEDAQTYSLEILPDGSIITS